MHAPSLFSLILLICFHGCNASFGNCDTYGQNCDWYGYWLGVWAYGSWAWVVAAVILGLMIVYMFIKCCCCCCLSILKCCVKGGTSCCSCSCLKNFAIWIVRFLVLAAFVAGLAGFILAILGWTKLDSAVKNTSDDYNTYLTVDLQAETNDTIVVLGTANSNLSSVGQMTSQSSLLAVLNSTEIYSANATQQSMVSTWNDFKKWYFNPITVGWAWLFWISIIAPGSVLLAILIAAIVLRCHTFLPTLLSILGFLAAALIWCTIGVACVGVVVINDACSEASNAVMTANGTSSNMTNGSYGYSLLNKLQCTQPQPLNEFVSTVTAYNKAIGAANEGACGSVRSQCSAGTMNCPTIPSVCTSYSQIQSLGTTITIASASSNGGCSSCTAQSCASTCTGATLSNASKGLVLSIQTASALTTSNTSDVTPLVNCEFIVNNFVVDMDAECVNAKKGAREILIGLIILGIASVAGILITVFLSHWFERRDHKNDNNQNGHGEEPAGDRCDLEGEARKEAAFQADIDSRHEEMIAHYPDEIEYPTPATTPHLPAP